MSDLGNTSAYENVELGVSSAQYQLRYFHQLRLCKSPFHIAFSCSCEIVTTVNKGMGIIKCLKKVVQFWATLKEPQKYFRTSILEVIPNEQIDEL